MNHQHTFNMFLESSVTLILKISLLKSSLINGADLTAPILFILKLNLTQKSLNVSEGQLQCNDVFSTKKENKKIV